MTKVSGSYGLISNALRRIGDRPRLRNNKRGLSPIFPIFVVTAKQQKQILDALELGKVDVVIGTHKLLSKEIKYKALGLVVIDEEHRFGVRQKEHFKKMRNELDLLTLTATPIPRTLNMAMTGLRDISIIASPPPNRHSIKTFITEWIDILVQEACQRKNRGQTTIKEQ